MQTPHTHGKHGQEEHELDDACCPVRCLRAHKVLDSGVDHHAEEGIEQGEPPVFRPRGASAESGVLPDAADNGLRETQHGQVGGHALCAVHEDPPLESLSGSLRYRCGQIRCPLFPRHAYWRMMRSALGWGRGECFFR